jgi:anti-sigma B factor antagonist
MLLAPQGRLDLTTAAEFQDAVREVVVSGTSRIVVDCSGIVFIDSIGLTAIVGGLKLARSAGGQLEIASAREQMTIVLELTSLSKLLHPYPDVSEAMSMLTTA